MTHEAPGLQSRTDLYELEILDGLKSVCRKELLELLGSRGKILENDEPDQITFEYSGHVRELFKLTTAVAVFQLLYFKVPRPQTVIQGGLLLRLTEAIGNICKTAQFASFRIGAAGGDSPAFQKIKKVIAQRSGLRNDEADGAMVIRFRRSRLKSFGWDVLIRLTPLPLSARPWRKRNMPGALNATIAAAMQRLVALESSDKVLNLMCGSGTLLAECGYAGARKSAGVDISDAHLRMACENLIELNPRPALIRADAKNLPFADSSFTALFSDLPWGRLIGNPSSLGDLYAGSLREAARVCARGGSFAAITQENKLFDETLESLPSLWSTVATLRVTQADYRPKIYILRRL